MLWLIVAFLVSILLVFLFMPKLLPVLQRLKFGQTEYQLGPQTHRNKTGTPTMGGLLFSAVVCAVTLMIVYITANHTGITDFALVLCGVAFFNMLIGFIDDYIKVVKKRNLGLIWWQKIIGQVVVSAAFSYFCYKSPFVGSKILIPFFNTEWDLGFWYLPLMTVFMIFMENSSNLQDGVDGILSSVTVVGAIGLMTAALVLPTALGFGLEVTEQYYHVSIFALALAGGCIGFLRYNYYPAKIFMGDTGSMFIGGAMVGMAMLLRLPIFLLFFSFTSIASSVSVILQRVYFKLTHGKRIFKMSPIHHHFELSGMSETQVVEMYTLVEVVLTVIIVLSIL